MADFIISMWLTSLTKALLSSPLCFRSSLFSFLFSITIFPVCLCLLPYNPDQRILQCFYCVSLHFEVNQLAFLIWNFHTNSHQKFINSELNEPETYCDQVLCALKIESAYYLLDWELSNVVWYISSEDLWRFELHKNIHSWLMLLWIDAFLLCYLPHFYQCFVWILVFCSHLCSR